MSSEMRQDRFDSLITVRIPFRCNGLKGARHIMQSVVLFSDAE